MALPTGDVDTLCFLIRNGVTKMDLAEAFWTATFTAEDMVVHGLVKPILRRGSGRGRRTFLRQDVVDLREELLARCRRELEPWPGERSLTHARRGVRLDLLWEAIRTGEVTPRYGHVGRFGLRYVMVREEDCRTLRLRSKLAGTLDGAAYPAPEFGYWRERVAEIKARAVAGEAIGSDDRPVFSNSAKR